MFQAIDVFQTENLTFFAVKIVILFLLPFLEYWLAMQF